MSSVLKRVLTGLTIGAGVVSLIVFLPVDWFLPVVAVLILLAYCEYTTLFAKKFPKASEVRDLRLLGYVLGYVVIAFGLLAIPEIATRHGNLMLLYVLAIIKFSDVGGFAFGLSSAKLMKGGNHKLCPSISPGKSWEGLLGSIVFSSVVSCAFIGITHFGVGKAIFFGVTAALVGTAGDLVESKFKCWVGVKDSSTWKITNGMGGVLDMLDSLLFAPAVFVLLLNF